MTLRPTDHLHREILSNGVTLLVQQRTNAPAAAQVTLVRAGFLDEPDTLIGVSHIVEHMLFKGTPTVGPGELAQRTKALGGALNAYTAYDRTVYYAEMPARNALAVGSLQADQVQRSVFDAEELRKELGVIIQEAKRKLDTPGALVGETLHRLLYHEHRLRRWRIGYEHELEAFTRDDIYGYYTSRYRPDRTIVALVSALEPAEALDGLRAQWSHWSADHEPIATGPDEKTFPSNETERFAREVTRADMALGWRAPGSLHPDAPALELASAVLSQGRASRLTRMLRDSGLVGAIGTAHYGTADIGVFAVGADLEPKNIERVVGEIGGAISALSLTPPDLDELDRVRVTLRARYQRSLERFEDRATALAIAEAEGDVTRLDTVEEEWLAVTPDQVSDVVRRYLVPDGVAGVVCVPNASDVVFDRRTLRGGSPSAMPIAAVHVAAVVPSAMNGVRTRRSAVHGVYHLATESLDILTYRHDAVQQTVLAWYHSRPESEDQYTAGAAALGIRSMLRGTVDRDTTALAISIEALGGSFAPKLGADFIGFGTTVLAEHTERGAALLAELMVSPRLSSDDVQIEQRLLLDDARAVEDDMLRFPVQLMFGEAFADKGYGSPLMGTETSLTSMNATTVRDWHTAWLRHGRGTLVAVGPGDPERLASQLAESIGKWEHNVRGVRQAPSSETRQRVHAGGRRVQRERQQSAIAMFFPGPARNSSERFAADVWSAIAGGLGGRLFESLRSERSLAYTVIASAWQRQQAGGLLTYIAMAPERLDEARAAMMEELAAFQSAPPSEEELLRATAMLIGQEEIARQTAGAWAGAIADAWLLGEGLEEIGDPGAPYRRVSAEDVHSVAAKAFGGGVLAEGIVAAS